MGLLSTVIPAALSALLPGRGTVYLVLIVAASAFGGGLYVAHKFHQANTVRAINEARVAERDAATLGNQHERGYLAKMRDQKEKADAKIEKLRKRLAAAPACRVPVSTGLRDGTDLPNAAGNAASTRPTPAAVDPAPTADARDVVLTCERNRLEVAEPNAEQLSSAQKWYRDLRRKYNR